MGTPPNALYNEFVIDFNAIDIGGRHGARTIVFLHAASYTRKMWLPQMRELNADFRVVAIDLRGHGARSQVGFDFDGCVDDIEIVVEKLGLGPVMFVGASLGGCIALEVARRSPDMVAGMVLAGSSFDATTVLCKMVLTGESVVFPRAESQLAQKFQRYVRKTIHASMVDEIVEAGCHWHSAASAVVQMRGRDFVGAIRSYDGPVLLVNGQRDWPHRFYERRFFDAAGGDVGLAVIRGANHICSLDETDEISEHVNEYDDKCRIPVLETVGE